MSSHNFYTRVIRSRILSSPPLGNFRDPGSASRRTRRDMPAPFESLAHSAQALCSDARRNPAEAGFLGAPGGIRTPVGRSRRVYSAMQLTTLPPTRTAVVCPIIARDTIPLMSRIRMFSAHVASLLVLCMPGLAFAGLFPDKIVTCTGVNCTPCDFAHTMQNILQFVLAAGICGWLSFQLSRAGFIYLTSGGDAAKAKLAKESLATAIKGILIALLSWTLANVFLSSILSPNFKWNDLC